MPTFVSFTVDFVSQTSPQAQIIFASPYSGCIFFFIVFFRTVDRGRSWLAA
jgi:hypothetical protein